MERNSSGLWKERCPLIARLALETAPAVRRNVRVAWLVFEPVRLSTLSGWLVSGRAKVWIRSTGSTGDILI